MFPKTSGRVEESPCGLQHTCVSAGFALERRQRDCYVASET